MRLTKGQILTLINEYIGVSADGRLGCPESHRFGYRTFEEFFPQYCNLDGISPTKIEGSIKQWFIKIFSEASSKDQAKIIRGVFKRFPPECVISDDVVICGRFPSHEESFEWDKRVNFQKEFLALADELEKSALDGVSNFTDSKSVLEALSDAETLLKDRGAPSAFDRAHTALHGYLLSICDKLEISYKKDTGVTGAFALLKRHQLFSSASDLTTTIFKALGSIFEPFNQARNDKSLAHPNPSLLEEEDALLGIELTAACIRCIAKKIAGKVDHDKASQKEILNEDEVPF